MEKELFAEISRKQQLEELLDRVREVVEKPEFCRKEKELERLLDSYNLQDKQKEIFYIYSGYIKTICQRLHQQSSDADRISRFLGMMTAAAISGGAGYLGGYCLGGEQQAVNSMGCTAIAGSCMEFIAGPFYNLFMEIGYDRKKRALELEYSLAKESAQRALEELNSNKLK